MVFRPNLRYLYCKKGKDALFVPVTVRKKLAFGVVIRANTSARSEPRADPALRVGPGSLAVYQSEEREEADRGRGALGRTTPERLVYFRKRTDLGPYLRCIYGPMSGSLGT